MSAITQKIYNSLKKRSSAKNTSQNNIDQILEQAYTLGMQFGKRGLKRPIAKLNEGGIFTKDEKLHPSMYRSDGTIKSAVGWKGPIINNITGGTMTELSLGEPGSKEGFYPLINPYTTDKQLEYIKNTNLEGNAKVLGESLEGMEALATAQRWREDSSKKGISPFVSYTSDLDEAKRADEEMKKELIRQQNTKEANVPKLQEGGSMEYIRRQNEEPTYLQETMSNVVPSGKIAFQEFYDAVTSPIDTAKSIYELGTGVAKYFVMPGLLEHQAAEGNPEQKAAVEAAGQHFVDRYGSLEKAKETLKNDPVGMVLETLGIATGVYGVGKLGIKLTANATDPIIRSIKKNKVAKIEPTPKRKDIVQGMPENVETDSRTMYHGDSMLDTKGGVRDLDAEGNYVPQKSFTKNEPLSLAVDVSNARSYAGVVKDKTGSSGFLYEVSIPKKVLNGLFDPFNENHIKIFKKRITIMLNKGQAEKSYDSINWKQVNDKDAYIENAYIEPMQLKNVEGSASKNNWGILENPDVVEALKKEGFTGTWQLEAARRTDIGLDSYNQIQLFDGSSVDIIPNKTSRIYRGDDGSYNISSFDNFLKDIDASKQGGVEIQTAEQFNKMLKTAKDAGEDIFFDGKKVDFGDEK